MNDTPPAFDALRRGHVVLAPDPFQVDRDSTRPWTVVINERHPFDGEQYVVTAMTTRTWYDERIPLTPEDYRHRRVPESSSLVPHALASLQPRSVSEYVCRIRDDPLDRGVERLREYLLAAG